MKTAIVQTSFWDEEEFSDLHLDTRFIYVHLLTNPSRGIANIMKINRKVIAARTGIDFALVDLALKQLEDNKYIVCFENYISLLRDHVQPKSGRFTQVALERELSTIPRPVLDALSQFVTGTIPEHKDIDIDKGFTEITDFSTEDKWRVNKSDEIWEEIDGNNVTFKR